MFFKIKCREPEIFAHVALPVHVQEALKSLLWEVLPVARSEYLEAEDQACPSLMLPNLYRVRRWLESINPEKSKESEEGTYRPLWAQEEHETPR